MGVGPFLGLSLGGALFDTIGGHSAYAVFAVAILLVGLAYYRFADNEVNKHEGISRNSPGSRAFGKLSTPTADDEEPTARTMGST